VQEHATLAASLQLERLINADMERLGRYFGVYFDSGRGYLSQFQGQAV